jgi:hypothetical protein
MKQFNREKKELEEFMLAWGRDRDESVGGTISEKNAAWWAWKAARGLLVKPGQAASPAKVV